MMYRTRRWCTHNTPSTKQFTAEKSATNDLPASYIQRQNEDLFTWGSHRGPEGPETFGGGWTICSRTRANLIGVYRSSVNFRGAQHFCLKNMYEKLTKCPNFTSFLREKLAKYPNFYNIFSEKLTKFPNFT